MPSLPTNGSMVTLNTCAMTCFAGSGDTGDTLGVVAFALEEGRRVALGRVRQQSQQHLGQFRDAGAGLGGAEAHRHEVILAQRLLERIVQLLGRELLALLEVERHQLFVDLDHLVDDLGVRRLDRGEVRRLAARLEEAVDDRLAAVGRQVERQAGLAEGFADLLEHLARCAHRGCRSC